MSESKKQTSGTTQSRTDDNTGERGQIDSIDSILTIGGILDEQSLRMVVGGISTGTEGVSGLEFAAAAGAGAGKIKFNEF